MESTTSHIKIAKGVKLNAKKVGVVGTFTGQRKQQEQSSRNDCQVGCRVDQWESPLTSQHCVVEMWQ